MRVAVRSRLVMPVLLLLLLALSWLAAGLVSYEGRLGFDPAWPARLAGGFDDMQQALLLHWRLPRVVAALIVGAALAVAGLLLQGVTRNPLADPYLLGISGGAGLMVVLVRCVVLVDALHWWLTPLAAFIGAVGAALFVIALARGSGGRVTVLGLILAGVVINALCAAMMSFVLARLDPFRLRVTTLWLAGGVGYAAWPQLALIAALTLGGILLMRAQAHRLNAFTLGTEAAAGVGVDVERMLLRASLLSSLLTALGVSLAGLLGYVGLIVPHAVRLLAGQDFRRTLSLSAVSGALVLLLADTVARTAFAPEELPVGVLTALLGCPVLLFLLKAQLGAGPGGARR